MRNWYGTTKVLRDPGETPESNGGSLDLGELNPESVVKFKAAGALRELPLSEVVQWAQKAIGAERRMQEAAEKERSLAEKLKAAEEAAAWKADFEAAKAGDHDAIRRFGQRQGWTEEQIEAVIAQRAGKADGTSGASQGTAALPEPQVKLLQRMQKFFEAADKAGIDPLTVLQDSSTLINITGESNAKNHLRNLLTKDPTFDRIMRSPKGDTILEDVLSKVKRQVAGGRDFQDAIGDAVNEYRSIVDAVAEAVVPKTPTSVHPGSLGMLPSGVGGRLQSPKPPKIEDYGHNPTDYLRDALAFAAFEAENQA